MPPAGCLRAARPLLVLLASILPGAAAADDAPFDRRTLRVEGRPQLAFALGRGDGARGQDLAVVTLRGGPPDEERTVVVFRPEATGATRHAEIAIPPDVVALDVADVDPAPGDELLLVSADAVEIRSVAGGAARRIPLSPPLPLPPRVRELSLLQGTGDWDGSEAPQILLPTTRGLRHLDLASGSVRALPAPVVADYATPDPEPPAQSGLLLAVLDWPAVARGDDDGDGRTDLFVLGRYGARVFRGGEDGLPEVPSRVLPLRPFTPEEELRPRATQIELLAEDLDGDGLTDLVLHRSFGTLLRSEHRTEVHRNDGDGASLSGAPTASLEPESGVGTLDLVDLDGDGRPELVQSHLGFGMVQLLRILTTRSAQVTLRVHRVEGPGIRALEQAWEGTLSVGLDLGQGRLEGLLPTLAGDWNGDGRRDLLYGASGDELALRLGRDDGAGFEGTTHRQETPAAGRALVSDLDGDGLDDLVVHDPRDATGRVDWLRNRGALPGTRPGLHAPERPQPDPAGGD